MRARRAAVVAVALAALVASAAGCGTRLAQRFMQTKVGAVVGSRLPIGWDEERAYGGAIATMIIDAYGGLYEDEGVVAYVNTVGQVVAAFSDRPDIPYHFGVLDTDEVNALSAPGGYVFVTRGALATMKDEAQLAGVLAHEVGHVAGKHALQIIQDMKTAKAAQDLADAWRQGDRLRALMDGYVKDYLERGLPQETEFDADRRAAETLQRVGYDARGLGEFLAALHEAEGHEDRFYKTHPDTSERLRALDGVIARLPEPPDGQRMPERFASAVAPVRSAQR